MFIKTIKKHPILLILIIGFFVYLGVMLPKTKGPVIYIETDQPTEDYVVNCSWASGLLVTHGGRQRVASHVAVIKSGETFDCGYSVIAALTKGYASVSILHPIHVFERDNNYQKDGVDYIVMNKTKLDLLDEQKAKFEAGYWNAASNPGFEYANNVGNCGLSFSYLDKYSQVKRVEKEHFRKLYNAPITECLTRVYKIYKKYRPKSSKQYTDGVTRMEKFWESQKWKKYE